MIPKGGSIIDIFSIKLSQYFLQIHYLIYQHITNLNLKFFLNLVFLMWPLNFRTRELATIRTIEKSHRTRLKYKSNKHRTDA